MSFCFLYNVVSENHSVQNSPWGGRGVYCQLKVYLMFNMFRTSGPSCSKLTALLVNISLKFQMLISIIFQYFLSKFEKLLQCKSFSHFFNKKFQHFGL